MKRILMATAALIVLAAPAAFAQQGPGDQHDRRGQDNPGGQRPGGQGSATPRPAPSGPVQQQAAPGGQRGQAGPRPDWNAYMRNNPDLQKNYQQNRARDPSYHESEQSYAERHFRDHGQAEGRAVPQAQGAVQNGGRDNNWQGRNNGQPWNGDHNRANGDQRDRGQRPDWRQYERNSYAQHRFRFGTYQRPHDWRYRRWTYGEFLPSFYWGQNYWLNNFATFGLPFPPPGCVWVRYGDDALLIDRYTGQIIQVVYGLFY